MEYERKDIFIGLFTLIAILVLISGVLAVTFWKGTGKTYPIRVSFSEFNNDITVGSQVSVFGYAVGSVSSIKFVSKPSIRFDVALAISEEVRLQQGTKAQISAAFIGSPQVILIPPEKPGPDLKPNAEIPGEPPLGITELVSDLAPKIFTTLDSVNELLLEIREGTLKPLTRAALGIIDDADAILLNTNRLIEENEKTVNRTLTSVEGNLSALASTLSKVNKTLDDVGVLMMADDGVRGTISEVNVVLKKNEEAVATLLTELNETMIQVRVALDNANRLIGDKNLDATLANVESITKTLSYFVRDLRKRPWILIRKDKKYEQGDYSEGETGAADTQ